MMRRGDLNYDITVPPGAMRLFGTDCDENAGGKGANQAVERHDSMPVSMINVKQTIEVITCLPIR